MNRLPEHVRGKKHELLWLTQVKQDMKSAQTGEADIKSRNTTGRLQSGSQKSKNKRRT